MWGECCDIELLAAWLVGLHVVRDGTSGRRGRPDETDGGTGTGDRQQAITACEQHKQQQAGGQSAQHGTTQHAEGWSDERSAARQLEVNEKSERPAVGSDTTAEAAELTRCRK